MAYSAPIFDHQKCDYDPCDYCIKREQEIKEWKNLLKRGRKNRNKTQERRFNYLTKKFSVATWTF